MIRRTTVLLIAALLAAATPGVFARQAEQSCDCEAERPATLATVNDVTIATSTIESDTSALVAPIKQAMDQVREQTLQQVITNRLVELEAAKMGLSSAKYIQQEVVAKAGEPTDEDLRAFYDRNGSSMGGKSFDEIKESLRLYIRTQRQQVQMTIVTTDLRTAAQIQVLEYSPTAPATAADRAKVLATVNGSKITSGELEDAIRGFMFSYRHKIWEIERDALDTHIDDILIAQEARRRNVTPDALVASDIAPKAKKVDAFAASKFYNDNKDHFVGHPYTEVRDDVTKYLEALALFDAKHAFAEGLRKTATIKDALVEPAPPTYEIATAGRPALGGATAPVTVVVFSDFQCPKCAALHAGIDAIAKEYAGKIRVVARNYPLEQHAMAYKAAEAAEAAYEQGKYWEYAALLFANQTDLTPERLKQFATQVGLDRAKFDAALESGRFSAVVDKDLEEGSRVGVQGTPAIYVNGQAVSDDSPAGLKAAIDAALKTRG
jgi:protein-disulfide isomerase